MDVSNGNQSNYALVPFLEKLIGKLKLLHPGVLEM